MEPNVITPDQWAEISRVLVYLYLFTGLGLTAAIGCLFAFGIAPSLVDSVEATPALGLLRLLAYPVSFGAACLAAYALVRGLSLGAAVAQHIYPGGWI